MIFRITLPKLLDNRRGVALLVTLALVSVLMTAALELSRRTGRSAEDDKKSADAFQAEEMARSGIELSMFILSRDAERNDTDSVQEIWADPVMMASAVQFLGFESGSLDVVISDELGKIQINALVSQYPGNVINSDQSALWERYLNLVISADRSSDLRDPAEIINSVKDWLDSGDDDAISGLSGAESEYYGALDPPVMCANGPLNTLDELFMIKGVTRDITALPEELAEMSLEENSSIYSDEALGAGLSAGRVSGIKSGNSANGGREDERMDGKALVPPDKIFTVYGVDSAEKEGAKFTYSGRININTANAAVIAAMLPAGLEDQAQELVDFRSEKQANGRLFANTLDKDWYKKVIALSSEDEKAFDRIIRYSSDIFRVDAKAKLNDAEISLTAFMRREKRSESGKWGCTVIQLKEN